MQQALKIAERGTRRRINCELLRILSLISDMRDTSDSIRQSLRRANIVIEEGDPLGKFHKSLSIESLGVCPTSGGGVLLYVNYTGMFVS